MASDKSKREGMVDVVVGLQYGDEGKGKVVDNMLAHGYGRVKYEWTARYQGGGNAGHTVYEGDEKIVLHTIPTGILLEDMDCVIGNGVVIDLAGLDDEMTSLSNEHRLRGSLHISDRAHVIYPHLRELEVASGDKKRRGTTGRGIGPAYTQKVARRGLRVVDFESRQRVAEIIGGVVDETKYAFPAGQRKKFGRAYVREMIDELMHRFENVSAGAGIVNASALVNTWLEEGRNGLAEGAQGTGLSIDHGTYPDVTSSNPEAGGACTGLGIGPTKVRKVVGIAKAYVTRVGTGPLPTLMDTGNENRIRKEGGEFGATTGRARRCGWFDAVHVGYNVDVNGASEVIITKPDVLAGLGKVGICNNYRTDGSSELVREFPANLEEQSRPNSSNYRGVLGWMKGWPKAVVSGRLHKDLENYIKWIEAAIGSSVTMVSVGPESKDIVEFGHR
jgi:adenylosuccinate synthase